MLSVRTSRSPGLLTARAEALFVTGLEPGEPVTREQVDAAITRAVRAHGGVRGCAVRMAGAFGENPERAVLRMRWATATVRALYSPMPTSAGESR